MGNHRKTARVAGLVTVIALALAACGSDGGSASDGGSSSGEQVSAAGESTDPSPENPPIDPGDGGNYQPELDPANFVDVVDNPYLPLVPGTTWTYEETNGDGETEIIEVAVTDERRDIQGISASVVRDTVTLDGVLVEDTFDWFAQDTDGNVWYLGEDVDNYENGQLVDHDGSFEYGVDGALPGIVMPADPQVGGVPPGVLPGRGRGHGRSAPGGRDDLDPGGQLRRRPGHRGLEPARSRHHRAEVLRPGHRPGRRAQGGR